MLNRFLAGLALVVSAFIASAAQAADRWYEVEVLVFAHLNADGSSERWPQLAALDPGDAIPAPGTPLALQAGADAAAALRIAGVPDSEYKLQNALRALSRSRQHRPVLHTAWRQAVGGARSSFKVRLAGGKAEPAADASQAPQYELDGFLRLSIQGYLRAEVDLQWQAPKTATAASNTAEQNWQIAGQNAPVVNGPFRLAQSRRVKSRELQYFDHPMFGVLVELRPLEPEQETDASAE